MSHWIPCLKSKFENRKKNINKNGPFVVKMSTVLCKHNSDNSSILYLSTNYAKGHNQIVTVFC